MLRRAPLPLCFALSLLFGCETEVLTEDGGGGAGGGTGGTGTGGKGGECTAFLDEPAPAPVTFRFRNQSGLDIYLPVTCDVLGYSLASIAPQDDVDYYPYEPACVQTCEELQSSSPFDCGAGACAASSLRIAHGESVDWAWSATGLQVVPDMPAACFFSPKTSGSSCERQIEARGGDYQLSINGYASCGPACTCDANGVCDGDATGNVAYASPATFSYPEDSVVEVLFDVCAFPCPG